MGRVYIVGAGPGDPGLLTLRAQALLQQADVCLYDRLIAPETMNHLRASCERIYVGKGPNDLHRVSQAETQRLMIAAAQAGKIVVRLKGGDPFVFGRGAEEAEACEAAGIPFEIVPGVTSALAVPAYLGIPITHRDAAGSFTVVTAHKREDGSELPLQWNVLAQLETLVFMMGVARLPEIVKQLTQQGRSPQTPIACISQGTLPQQRSVVGTLHDVIDKARTAQLQAPAVIVVGDVVRYSEKLAWFEKRPLFGKTIWVTRDAAHASRLTEPLRALGARVLETPVIAIVPNAVSLKPLLAELKHFSWIIFTSRHAVAQFMQKLFAAAADVRALAPMKIASVGPGTTEALREYGLTPDLVPSSGYVAEALIAALPQQLQGQQILFPKAKHTRTLLLDGLTERGATVHSLELYETVCADTDLKAIFDQYPPDLVTFTSSSIVERFVELIQRAGIAGHCFKGISIGPITSQSVRNYLQFLVLAGEAEQATLAALVAAVRSFFSS